MISVITRCRNRLEYTAQVVDAVFRRTRYDYEHIIIDNASSDGTKEWFHWMADHSWLRKSKIRYVRMESNHGDWGGMLTGAKIAQGDYIVQLDNDIIPCEGWLTSLFWGISLTKYKLVMLRRENVAWKLKPLGREQMIRDLVIAPVERAVACYIIRKDDFMNLGISEEQGMKSKYIMAKKLGRCGKIMNRTCIEIEAVDQRQKYSPKDPEIWEKV